MIAAKTGAGRPNRIQQMKRTVAAIPWSLVSVALTVLVILFGTGWCNESRQNRRGVVFIDNGPCPPGSTEINQGLDDLRVCETLWVR